jgi:hypothetical protein
VRNVSRSAPNVRPRSQGSARHTRPAFAANVVFANVVPRATVASAGLGPKNGHCGLHFANRASGSVFYTKPTSTGVDRWMHFRLKQFA